MNQQNQQMREAVLSRVRSIHYMRTTVRPFLVKAGSLTILIIGIFFLVSVPSVIQNLANSQQSYLDYILGAFFQTRLIVQMVLVATIVLGFLTARDMAMNLKYFRIPTFRIRS